MEVQKSRCINHPDKESAFYCFKHLSFVCLRCVAAHVQCQVENQFYSLEEVFETLQQDLNTEEEASSQKLKEHSSQIESHSEKMSALEGLKNQDLTAIKTYFEDLKLKAEEIKQKVLQNYENSFSSILEKIVANNSNLAQIVAKENDHHAKVQELQAVMKKQDPSDDRRIRAVELRKEFDQIKLANIETTKFQKLDHELEFLMSKEEVFSEVGNLTMIYHSIPSKVAEFMTEHMKEHVSETHETRKPEETEHKERETLDDMIQKIDYMKEENQVFEENFLKALEDKEEGGKTKTRLHQLRFCSNEVNIFDCATNKFSCYELYTTKSYKTPFFIYNNCCSVLHKNHLVFLFGGEDPAMNDKSSNRVFCFNLDQATAERKVVVYEISPMLNSRQEFTLATVGNSIYVISGYDSNKGKEYRVIPKCERLDIKTKSFYEIREINYPRQSACSVNVNNTHIYTFAGQNPKYMNFFVDKIERYTLNLNDWSVVKFSVMNEFNYEPGINSTAFRLNDSEIVILGGQREFDVLNGFYVFDMRKLLFVKKQEGFLEEPDNFYNQNDVEADKDGAVRLFSSNMTNLVYQIQVEDSSTNLLNAKIIQKEDL